ncbi:hypothetical protein KAFR_0C01850 [Kazachstania africana CBS 2517]|uniref:J domain-containing protein n=1 Tax=Kazachstania africana (strain ATCC 22294 / BCRC 22015 / CBS 2517 / CECT 1963 / NBRC 1671 / NRRL Y-8276) TaxID=1071382 RepID=H2AS28_KAZAF|nr:hypothetical protein KAFR_0C01850 [Kazachstania africana CBS 2517]CCF57178.1 hypothetical protein KAFR_0C01850 [Kazachstania africana CBS 2517]
MSDPFANLLESFKENGKKPDIEKKNPVPVKSNDVSSISLNSTLQPKKLNGINTKVSTLSTNSVPTFANVSSLNSLQTTPIHDDFEELFGSSTSNNFSVSPEPTNNFKTVTDVPNVTYEAKQDSVVDEVKDMEIAQLMSLGLSIEKANSYYSKGISYDTLLKKLERRRYGSRKGRDTPTFGGNTNKDDKAYAKLFDSSENTNLFSMASGLFNKGKEFIDQMTAYPEETDRLSRYRDISEISSMKPLRKSPGIVDGFDMDRISQHQDTDKGKAPTREVQQESPPPSHDLLDNFQNNLKLDDNKEELSKESVLLDIDNDDSTLLKSKSLTSDSLLFQDENVLENSNIPKIPISSIELSGYNEYNSRGSSFFKNGDYISALEEYEKSLNTLPQSHPLRIIAYSNITAAELKIGEYSNLVKKADKALKLFPKENLKWNLIIQDSEPHKSYKDIWSKLVLRKAEALEHLENFELAYKQYHSLIENNVFSDKIMDGKRRCQKVLNPEIAKKTQQKPSSSKPAAVPTPSTQKYESVERIKEQNRQEEENEAEKLKLYDIVEAKINAWKSNKPEDIRHLLANLPTILTWTEWKPISVNDLVMPKKVKVTYLKAIAKTHPDKISSSLNLESKMIAENAFSTLSVAWDKFKEENNMN